MFQFMPNYTGLTDFQRFHFKALEWVNVKVLTDNILQVALSDLPTIAPVSSEFLKFWQNQINTNA